MIYKLLATVRTKKGAKARTKSVLPAVVYGVGQEPAAVGLNYDEFAKLYHQAGEATLIDLVIGDKDGGKVLIKDMQYDPVTDRIIHVDLKRIDMNKTMTATIELRFVGETPIIKEQGGTLMHNVEEVEVECLPKDLVSHIDVDLSVLKTFDDSIKVKNLVVPSGITIINFHAEDLVAKAAPALTEEEIKAMEEAAKPADLSEIEVAGKKKEEAGEAAADEEAKPEENPKGGAPAEKKEEKK